MKFYPEFDEFAELANEHTLVPVFCDFYGDTETPLTTYTKLRGQGPSFMLESIVGGDAIGRYTFIGCNPLEEISIFPEQTIIKDKSGKENVQKNGEDPLAYVEDYLSKVKTPQKKHNAPPFTGGAVGYIAYEYVHHVENTVPKPDDTIWDTPVAYFLITETLVIFDHAKQTLTLCANAHVEGDPKLAYQRATEQIRKLAEQIKQPLDHNLEPFVPGNTQELAVESNFTKENFMDAVKRVKEYITEGDIFQGVISQRFSADYPLSPLDLYRSLRVVNPSPYMVLLENPNFGIVSASPEVHVKVLDGEVEIRPIAGTRPRGKSWEEDLAYEKELLGDEKEKAEHLMLVDLARNDIGRVCKIGSIEIPQFMTIERYSHVMHIVSQVFGELDDDKNAFDLLRATFPAGTISGAPKVRAMQIIAELEKTQRGLYSGAMGYFGFDGNHDSCIAIRTAMLKDGKAFFQAGAGIVADSDPEFEYIETVNKSKGILNSLQQSLGFLR